MTGSPELQPMARNVSLYPWFKMFQSLLFWQAVWFLYFQDRLSAADAILLYAIYDIGTIALEVPSGYMSDRLGRRFTLIAAMVAGLGGSALLALGDSFAAFAAGQLLIGASTAFISGTDSALLYESLAVLGREREVERQELRAWRFAFTTLAVSAVAGGAMALAGQRLPFLAGLVAFAGGLFVCLRFTEPRHVTPAGQQGTELLRLGALKSAFGEPVLRWLFGLSMLMYAFSHVPFVFGQPFILEALAKIGLAPQAPMVSGAVTSVMMLISVGASLFAPWLRRAMGLAPILLLAFALQIALCGLLALTNDAVAIGFLFLRMVPNALSRPFVAARMQPLLSNAARATYMSLQSFCGRLILSASLFLAAGSASAVGQMPYAEIQRVLAGYVLAGLVCLGLLTVLARRRGIEAVA
jgi:MFS family permease